MAMFDENFSFHAPSSPSTDSTANASSSTREPSRSVSPCSTTTPFFPQPRFSVTDLAASFANSRLRSESQICYDPCNSYANTDDDAGWEIPSDDVDLPSPTRAKTAPPRSYSPSRRMQRQSSTRLLCSASHVNDIADLVARMVHCQDQCTVATSEPASPSAEEDEGYNSSETHSMRSSSRRSSVAVVKSRLDYRRSSDFRSTGACVSKTVRLRKATKQRNRISSPESES